jgi:hypothetical protein
MEDTHPLFQPSHLQPLQGCVLGLLNPLELHLEEVALELLVGVVMLELAIHADVAVKAPVPIFADCLVQSGVSHRRPFEELQKPVGCGHDHVVVVAVVVGCHIDLLDPRDLIWSVLFGESRHATIRELLDPVSGLPHPILDRDGKTRAVTVLVEHIPLRAFFSGESGAVVDKACSEEFKFFSLTVMLLGPLFTVLLVFAFALLKGTDKSVGNVSDGVEAIGDLDGGCHSTGGIDRARVLHGFDGSGGRQ